MNMKRFRICIVLVFLLSEMVFFQVHASNDESAWVLKDVIDYARKEEVKEYNENNKSYELSVGYSSLAYFQKRKYIGKDDNYYDPPKVNGESLYINANWSTPPNEIKEGEEVELKFSLAALENTLSFFSFDGGTNAMFDKADIKPGSGTGSRIKFKNKDGKYDFVINKKNNYKTINETVSAVPRKGSKDGDQIALMITFKTPAGALATKYIYEWTNKRTIEKNNQTGTSPEQTPASKEGNKPDVVVIELEQEFQDSGVRFSDLWGDVQIRHKDDRLAWDFGQLDMTIYEGDHIRTGQDSGCIISLPDMTTFHMKPNSELIIITRSEAQNKLKLLAGKIIANVKQMMEDGSMDVEMSEAVCGIKGTTFVVEDDGIRSTLKVLEGIVEVTKKSGEKTVVGSSEKIDVKNGVFGKIEKFSASKELQEWDKKTQLIINEALKEKGIALDDTQNTSVFVFIGIGITSVLVLIIILINKRRTANRVYTP